MFSCRLSDDSAVRAFKGNAGIGSFSFLVTVRTTMPWQEYDLFRSYSSPGITGLACEEERVVVMSGQSKWTINAANVISGRFRPVEYTYGTEVIGRDQSGLLPFDRIRIALGVALSLLGSATLIRTRFREKSRTDVL